MKYKIIIMLLLCASLSSCEDKVYVERINKIKLIEGEYYSEVNSKEGFSVRDNKIAFFRNMEFGSDDIYEYVLVDSMVINGSVEEKIASYLKRTDLKDTLYTEIDKRTDSVIGLKLKKQLEVFKLKTRIVLKEE